MKLFHSLFTFLLFLMSCVSSNDQPVIVEKEGTKKTVKKLTKTKAKKAEKAIITNRNVEERLLAYGKENPETIVLIKTGKGDIKVRLFKDTPLHRASFILMAKNDCFNQTVFTRVVKDFMAQAGGTYEKEMVKKRNDIGKYTIPAEIMKGHIHKSGAVGAARSYNNNPDKRSSPFNFYFVEGSTFNELTLNKYEELNNYTFTAEQRRYYMNNKGAAHIDGQHTVFGEIIDGFEVVPKLTSVAKTSSDWPETDIYITEVIVLE